MAGHDVIVEYGGQRWLVEPDGLVRQWDAVAGYYSVLSAAAADRRVVGRVRALARREGA